MEGRVIIRHNGSWLYFDNPQRIYSTDKTDEVLSLLRKVENHVEHDNMHAAGFISYEAAPAFDNALEVREKNDSPLLWFGIYNEPARIDTLPAAGSSEGYSIGTWLPDISRKQYDRAIDAVRDHIICGDTYQVNFTFRMNTAFTGSPLALFHDMVNRGPAPYCAFIDTGRFAICSASPELFFDIKGRGITCLPMKGTVKRGLTTAGDAEKSAWLKNSEKNRAENIMITDMIRNDLGRIAGNGSVNVPALFETERYMDMWQMTSRVCAETESGLSEIMRALFPCASITGAPKVRTMKIIRELESSPRGIYTGCIGHAAPGRSARFNVAIRTVTIDRETNSAVYGTGGGIVSDSTSEEEYNEALLKTYAVTKKHKEFRLFETILRNGVTGFTLLERHLARMKDSAHYFGFRFCSEHALKSLYSAVEQHGDGDLRIKLFLERNGSMEVMVSRLHALPGFNSQYRAVLASSPVHSGNVFLYHKTTERSIYGDARKQNPGYDDVLLYNERGEITEFTIGNFAALLNGKLYTPPVECGLLAGTYRAGLIESGHLEEGIVRVEQLDQCDEVFMINSVRGRQRVYIC